MKTPNISESGQILILLAVGIVALLGFTALAIDGGAVFFDRRSAQNAADAAALAGAYELANDPWDTGTLKLALKTPPMAEPTIIIMATLMAKRLRLLTRWKNPGASQPESI